MSNRPLIPFHGAYERDILPFIPRNPLRPIGSITTTETKHFVVEDRTLGYAFSTHTHPYAGRLVDRLIDGSVRGLQAADTEFHTVAVLSAAAQGALGEGTLALPGGELVSLLDGARIVIVAGARSAKLVADHVLDAATDEPIALADGAVITITAGTRLRRADRTAVSLVADVAATLPRGGPEPVLFSEIFTPARYNPTSLVQQPYPVNELDFSSQGAYSVYNWELFYHVPLTVGIHLSRNQRFEEAQRWFHHIFDPTDDSDAPAPERYWKVKPLRTTDVRMAEELLVNLSSNADPALREHTLLSIAAWKDAPFRPHVIARYRQSAHMFKAVMAYLDNLIVWGDSLFRQDTPESVDEAMQLYVLAANILGRRPQAIPRQRPTRAQTYAEFRRGREVDAFGNVVLDLENEMAGDLTPPPLEAAELDRFVTLRTLGSTLYFCVPRNEKLTGYWDTVADRLFKIRNSLNIQGVFRQLPLFEPPIDPALLARAAAAGLDIGAVISGANQPLPLVRFSFLIQKASEICQEVKSLGASLLSAMEKEDNEALSVLRAKHERVILGLTESVRYAAWQEAIKAREGLVVSIATAAARYTYYERLLGREESEVTIPDLEALDVAALEKGKLRVAEPAVSPRDVAVDIVADAGGAKGRMISKHEEKEIARLEDARRLYDSAAKRENLGSLLSLIPDFGGEVEPMGVGASLRFGGTALSRLASMSASSIRTEGDGQTYKASKAARIAGYDRREQDWAFQSNLAAGEITQLLKQLRGAEIREAMAEREWKNHQQQIRNAEEVERFLSDEKSGKKTSRALYTWMKRETKGLYAQCFQFAFDVAKKAERALQHELGDQNVSVLQFGYLAGREGLLAGERLHLDIKRMEMAYHELNQREYELTKHVSVLQVAPEELLRLRTTGKCTVTIPEALLDLDCPGHYFRRIRSAAVTIPCVVGPYATVNCTLSLQRSRIRRSAAAGDGYQHQGDEDHRFVDFYGSVQSIVTSSAQNDTGLFETNLRDERYLPFEGYGVESTWTLSLPGDPSKDEMLQFDYATIADVVLHLRYTAREGGQSLRTAATAALGEHVATASAAGTSRLFSMRNEFPSEWARFKAAAVDPAAGVQLAVPLREEHYPFWSRGRLGSAHRLGVFARSEQPIGDVTVRLSDGREQRKASAPDKTLGGLHVALIDGNPLPAPDEPFALRFAGNAMDDVWLTVGWGKE